MCPRGQGFLWAGSVLDPSLKEPSTNSRLGNAPWVDGYVHGQKSLPLSHVPQFLSLPEDPKAKDVLCFSNLPDNKSNLGALFKHADYQDSLGNSGLRSQNSAFLTNTSDNKSFLQINAETNSRSSALPHPKTWWAMGIWPGFWGAVKANTLSFWPVALREWGAISLLVYLQSPGLSPA